MGFLYTLKELELKFICLDSGLSTTDLYKLEAGQRIVINALSDIKLTKHPCLFEGIDDLFLRAYYYFPPLDFSQEMYHNTSSYYIPEYGDRWAITYPTERSTKYNG